jgi:hypothetical protein
MAKSKSGKRVGRPANVTGPLTTLEAEALGFTVDHHAVPKIGYRGPRFRPTETVLVTDQTEVEAARRANAAVSAGRDAVAKGAVLVSSGPTVRIATAAVLAVRALQQEKRVLEADLKRVAEDLKAQEPPIIAALEAGVPTEPGCPPVAIKVDEKVTPRWKDEALTLAAQAGKIVSVYEREVRERTVPTVSKHLVINGDGKKGGA